PLDLDDAAMRIEGIYRPYHKTLQKLLADTINQFGVAVLIDCHSMPRLTRSNDRTAPDVVLGDRYGTTCAPDIVALAETVFASAGLKVARNRPYAGGHTTRSYGRPHYGVHALQIEISRHLYMHESTLRKHEGFAMVEGLATRLIGALIAIDTLRLAAASAAAE